MFIPIVPTEPMTDEEGQRTKPWDNFFQQQAQNMQESLSNEGFVIPSQSNDNMLIIQNGVNPQGAQIAMPGTLIFNTDMNKLYVLLNDGTFHSITTT